MNLQWLLPIALFVAPLSAQWKTPWSYAGAEGPAHWAQLDPGWAACNGQRQSPIDVRGAQPASLPPLEFAFHSGPVNIINNGYTAVRVDYPEGNGNVLTVGHKHYELTQFHFHHPSEEAINGKVFPMGLHIMMAAADGSVGAVAIMVNQGESNAAAAALWPHMPATKGPLTQVARLELDPSALLPAERGYYQYDGSQTAPPCTENVTWYVLKTPITLSAQQIAAFAKLYPHDVRPVQLLHGRVIRSSR